MPINVADRGTESFWGKLNRLQRLRSGSQCFPEVLDEYSARR
jgi:hypothetical protein